jgi:hypothetical protein
MLCPVHREQETIHEPAEQLSRHLDLGRFLLEKEAFAEAQEHLACGFELDQLGLVPQTDQVLSSFVGLLQALEAQGKETEIHKYLDKGQHLDFQKLVAGKSNLHIVKTSSDEA